jgi:hypothetical protein
MVFAGLQEEVEKAFTFSKSGSSMANTFPEVSEAI